MVYAAIFNSIIDARFTMIDKINCPNCQTVIYLPSATELRFCLSELICPSCYFKYTASCLITVTLTTEIIDSKRKLHYLSGLTAKNESVVIEFFIEKELENFTAVTGDEIILIQAVNQQKKNNLIWLQNLANQSKQKIFIPSKLAIKHSFKIATFTASSIVGLAIGSFFYPILNFQIILISALPFSLVTGIYSGLRQHNQYKETNKTIKQRLLYEQTILGQINNLNQRIKQLKIEQLTEENLLHRFQNLLNKIQDTDPELYANRINLLTRGLAALEKKFILSRNLISGYQHLQQIWEIEYETSKLIEEIPEIENIEAKALNRLQELESLEVQKEQLSLTIEPAKLLTSK